MTSISQIIPNYSTGGISDQPDELKKPGQLRKCLNAYPDLIHGLYRRPGFELLGTLTDPCNPGNNVNKKGTWFPFIRQDPTNGKQQNFLFNINKEGEVRAYDIEGNSVDVHYRQSPLSLKKLLDIGNQFRDSTDDIDQDQKINISDTTTCSSVDYLNHEDFSNDLLRTVVINDLVVVTNPTEIVRMGKDSQPRPYEAFIEVKQVAYGRDYDLGINIGDGAGNNATYKKVTGINLIDAKRFHSLPNDTGDCPAIFNQTLTFDSTYVTYTESGNTSGRSDLQIEINTRGSQDPSDGDEYFCNYTHNLNLIDGGRGWQKGDRIKVFRYGANGGTDRTQEADGDDPHYIIEITEVETVRTPYDAVITGQNLSTGENIGNLLTKLKQALAAATYTDANNNSVSIFTTQQLKKRGNGIYISSTEPFSIETTEKDLFNILSPTEEVDGNPYAVVNNVSQLPIECKNNMVVKVSNSFSDDDDYWVKFKTNFGDIDSSSVGYWKEIAEPNTATRLNSNTMPHVILFAQKDSNVTVNGVTPKQDIFIVAPLNWDKRTCGTEDLNPSFVNKSISNIHFYRNRLVFLSDDSVVMSRAGDLFNLFPATALTVAPSDPIDISVSSNYSSILKNAIVINNGLVLFGKYQQFVLSTANDILSPETAKISEIGRYEFDTDSRPFALGTNIGFMGLSTEHSKLFELTNVFSEGPIDVIERSKIVSKTLPRNLDLVAESKESGVVFLGKRTTNKIFGYRYFKEGNQNSLQSCWFEWELPYNLVNHFIIDGDYYAVIDKPGSDIDAQYVRIPLDTRPDNPGGQFVDLWSAADPTDRTNTVTYTTKFEFPTINIMKPEQQAFRADTTASLVVHRTNWNFADIGSYEFVISRSGMDDYTVLYESRYMDAYEADDSPVISEVERTVPVYTRNIDLGITLRSNFEHPLVLRSMRWEGDYNSRYYQRV